MPANRIAVVVVLAILAMGGVGAVQSSFESNVTASEDATQITDESVTIQHGQTHQLDASDQDVVYGNESTVTVEQNGTTYQADGNWTWLRGNGTLSVPSDSGMSDSEDALVDYQYTEPQESQRLARDVTMLPLELSDMFMLIVMAAALLAAVGVFSRGGR